MDFTSKFTKHLKDYGGGATPLRALLRKIEYTTGKNFIITFDEKAKVYILYHGTWLHKIFKFLSISGEYKKIADFKQIQIKYTSKSTK